MSKKIDSVAVEQEWSSSALLSRPSTHEMLTFIYITYLLGVKGIFQHFGKCPYCLNPPECPVHVAALNMHFFFFSMSGVNACASNKTLSLTCYVLSSFRGCWMCRAQLISILSLLVKACTFFGLKDPCNCPVMGMFGPLFTTSSKKKQKAAMRWSQRVQQTWLHLPTQRSSECLVDITKRSLRTG